VSDHVFVLEYHQHDFVSLDVCTVNRSLDHQDADQLDLRILYSGLDFKSTEQKNHVMDFPLVVHKDGLADGLPFKAARLLKK
jgi:hypothetical protein